MKTKFFLFALIATLGLMSCKKNDCDCNDPNKLEGTWHMESVHGGLAGIHLNYIVGEVAWKFDEANNMVKVTNNILTTGPKSIYARFATGTYTYAVSTLNNQNTLTIDSIEVGVYSFSNGKLMIDDGVAVDGMMTEFIR